jgi:hypothetical protein
MVFQFLLCGDLYDNVYAKRRTNYTSLNDESHREWNPRLFGLWNSASTIYAAACKILK